MAKSLFLKTTAIALCATSFACAGENMNIQHNRTSYPMVSGSESYGSEIIESIHANGLVKLDGTTVKGCVEVNGQLNADHADIDSLLINGKANLNHCHVQGKMTINGFLVSEHTSFQGEISVCSEKTVLSCSTLSSIHIRKTTGSINKQILDLRDGTIIYEDIVFESGNGQVVVDADCTIIGSVHGGTIWQR